MMLPANSTGQDGTPYGSRKYDRGEVLARLRQQSRWAALLLFSPWLMTLSLNRSILREQPTTALALLPGLAVAFHLQRQLSRHLAANHCQSDENRLFANLGAANWITLLRAGAVIGLAGFLPAAIHQGQGLARLDGLIWVPGLIYLVISMADLLDGFVARRQGRETELGKRLDIETDAAGLLVASLLAVALDRLPVVYLLVGLAYYPFIFALWMRQRRALPVIVLQSRPSSRIIAGFQMGLVGMVLLPIFHPPFTSIAAYIFMTPLLIGFFRDWLVVSCRLKTDAHQQTRLEIQLRVVLQQLPLVLRPALFAGGIITFLNPAVSRIDLPWQGAAQCLFSLCCLLAAAGFMGRSAALLLILLLGSTLSPFGISPLSLGIFSIAAVLLLTGTSAMSLWSPEEPILYRRCKKSSREDSQTP